jgi:hypothetical protein
LKIPGKSVERAPESLNVATLGAQLRPTVKTGIYVGGDVVGVITGSDNDY